MARKNRRYNSTEAAIMTNTPTDKLQTLFQNLAKAKSEVLAAAKEAYAGPVSNNYTFQTPSGPATLLDLFQSHNDLLIIHNMGKRCNYCSLWADGLSSLTKHITQRTAFVLTSPDDIETLKNTANTRGWTFNIASTSENNFTKDMGYENNKGGVLPGVSAFHKDKHSNITRTSSMPFGPGDDFCPIWPLFDLLKLGHNNWQPT